MARWIFGIHPVREGLRLKRPGIDLLLVKKGEHGPSLRNLVALAGEAGIRTRRADQAELKRLCRGGNHQGVAARAADFEYADFDAWLAELAAGRSLPDLLALDGVQDPHNLGSLLRSAENFAAGGVIIPKNRSASVTEAAARTSAGAADLVPVVRVVNLVRTLQSLKEAGYWIIGTAVDAEASLFETDLNRPCVFVLGGEEKGLRALVRRRCDVLAALPRLGRIESLNVAVSGGIVLAEAHRQKSFDSEAGE